MKGNRVISDGALFITAGFTGPRIGGFAFGSAIWWATIADGAAGAGKRTGGVSSRIGPHQP